jgi:hypothetical protein
MIGRIFVAMESISCQLNGEQLMIFKGDTVREGHPLLERYGMFFSPQRVKFEHKPPAKAPAPRRAK